MWNGICCFGCFHVDFWTGFRLPSLGCCSVYFVRTVDPGTRTEFRLVIVSELSREREKVTVREGDDPVGSATSA